MKGRFFIFIGLLVVGHILGAMLVGTLTEGSLWAVEVFTVLYLCGAGLWAYQGLKEHREEVPETQAPPEEEIKAGLRSLRNITSGIEQLGSVYAETITALDRVTGNLRQLPSRMAQELNGTLQERLSSIKNSIEELIPLVIQIKTEVKRTEEVVKDRDRPEIQVHRDRATEEGLQNLARLIGELKQTVSILGEAHTHTLTETRGLIEAFAQVASSVKEMGAKTDGMRQAALEGESQTEDIEEALEVIKESIRTLMRHSGSLQRITSRAKLLSINAQVAAVSESQGGEAFSVVAEEILTLSQEATELTIQVTRLLHEVSGKTELSIDTTRDIRERFKSIAETLEDLGQRFKDLSTEAISYRDRAMALSETGAHAKDGIQRLDSLVRDGQRQMEEILTRSTDQRYPPGGGLQLQRVLEEQRGLIIGFLEEAGQRIERSTRLVNSLLQDIDTVSATLEKIKAEQRDRCTNAEGFIEETVVLFEQLRGIDAIIRSLEKEVRTAERTLEGLLR